MMATPRVALIDDDRLWLETLADFLRDRGYDVRTALGGTRGLDLLTREGIGLAVVDFHMPDCNGLELVRQLRRRRLDVDVLLMSSDDDPTLPTRALAEGAAAFLSKSLAPSLLLRSLTQTLAEALTAPARRRQSRWDRFLPVPRPADVWLPVLFAPHESERN